MKIKYIVYFASLRGKIGDYNYYVFFHKGTRLYHEARVYMWWFDREEQTEKT